MKIGDQMLYMGREGRSIGIVVSIDSGFVTFQSDNKTEKVGDANVIGPVENFFYRNPGTPTPQSPSIPKPSDKSGQPNPRVTAPPPPAAGPATPSSGPTGGGLSTPQPASFNNPRVTPPPFPQGFRNAPTTPPPAATPMMGGSQAQGDIFRELIDALQELTNTIKEMKGKEPGFDKQGNFTPAGPKRDPHGRFTKENKSAGLGGVILSSFLRGAGF